MRTSLKKLLHHHHNSIITKKGKKIQPLAQLDELANASEDMQDMRDCYDHLLSAAAAAANSAYEFSESLREMGVCLLQKIALNDDEQAGKVMIRLGRVQFDLQKLVDSYRAHIFQTITVPSESLLNELQTVEEMKHQCFEKREMYEYMRARYQEKGRSKSGKGESFSLQQLHSAKDEFDEEATLFVFRVKSLKQGQSRSLLTQAARHHAAQLCFFRKALKALEEVEPDVKVVTQQQHIDYQFSGLEDDESEDGEDDYDDDGFDHEEDADSDLSSAEEGGELSFDYRSNERRNTFASSARSTMEMELDNITFPSAFRTDNAKESMKNIYEERFVRDPKMLSQSAPLLPQQKFDPAERIQQSRQSATKKFHSYALPKPGDTTSTVSLSHSENPGFPTKSSPHHLQNLYHSYPLEPTKYEKIVGTPNLSGPIMLNSKSILRESNDYKMPPPLSENISSTQCNPHATSSIKKMKLQSFSGPLTSKSMATKPSLSTSNPPISREPLLFSSGPILRNTVQRSVSPSKASPSTSPTFTSSPRINELHELPRPPVHVNHKSSRHSGFVGFSAPLVSRSPENSSNKLSAPKIPSPLPTPPTLYASLLANSPRASRRSSPCEQFEIHSSLEKPDDIVLLL